MCHASNRKGKSSPSKAPFIFKDCPNLSLFHHNPRATHNYTPTTQVPTRNPIIQTKPSQNTQQYHPRIKSYPKSTGLRHPNRKKEEKCVQKQSSKNSANKNPTIQIFKKQQQPHQQKSSERKVVPYPIIQPTNKKSQENILSKIRIMPISNFSQGNRFLFPCSID